MTKRIYGGYDVTHNATVQGKRTIQSVDETALFDSNGNMDLDGYTKNELTEIIGVLPISHYGTHNYLPAGVSGDFVGSSENANYRRAKNLLEDDGTLVVLRAGTNGSENGLYYSYISDILNRNSINNISINTNKQYMPDYIPNDLKPIGAVSSNSGVVVGYLQVADTNSESMYFFTSLTNGTLNDTQHVGFLIPSSTVLPEGGELVFVMLGTDGLIYYFGILPGDDNFTLSVVTVAFNKQNGTFTSSRLTGFNGSLFYSMNNSTNIKMAGTRYSKQIINEPYWLCPPDTIASQPFQVAIDMFAVQDPATNNIKIRINGDAYISVGYAESRIQHGFSFTLNPNTKLITLDSEYAGTPNQPGMISTVSSNIINSTGKVINDDIIYNHANSVNIGNTYHYTDIGYVICISTENLQRPLKVQVGKYDTALSPYEMMNYKKYSSRIVSFLYGLMYESYGSVIGSFLIAPELLSTNSTKQISTSPDGTITTSYAIHDTSPTFSFGSNTYGTLNGYKPTSNRKSLPNDNLHKIIMSSISGSSITSNGGIFIQGIRESTPLTYDSTMNGTGSISVDSTALLNFKNSEFSKLNNSILDNTSSKDCTLYVPRQSDIPAFALLSTVGVNGTYIYRFVEVNVNTRVGLITSISFKTLVKQEEISGGLFLNASNGFISDASTGVTIYDAGTFYFIGGADPVMRLVVGNTLSYYFRGIVDKSSSTFTNFDVDQYHTYTSYSSGHMPFALPNNGFGIITQVDNQCKLCFFSYGTTLSDYSSWTSKVSKPINVVSQDVENGFVVYFTEETPVILSGKTFTLPVTSIDLKSITPDPQNKVFQIYVKMVQGIASYEISENVIAESGTTAYNLMWIGSLRTNDIQIDNIDVIKRARIDIFGDSLQAAGSSFPVSYGTPTSTGTINW